MYCIQQLNALHTNADTLSEHLMPHVCVALCVMHTHTHTLSEHLVTRTQARVGVYEHAGVRGTVHAMHTARAARPHTLCACSAFNC